MNKDNHITGKNHPASLKNLSATLNRLLTPHKSN